METLQAISKRTSIREYSPKPIPKEMLETLIEAGRRAPTARAIEPWEFIIVGNAQALSNIASIADHGRFIAQASACIAVFCENTKYYLEDGCAATQNILLAVTDLGLGACWVAGDKKDYCTEIANLLGVPENYKLVSLISLGWPKSNSKKVQNKKRGVSEVIHWNTF